MPHQSMPILNLPVVAQGTIEMGRAVVPISSTWSGLVAAQATVAGSRCIGVSMRQGAAGAELEIVSVGVATAIAGGAVPIGSPVATDAQGRMVVAAALAVATGATAVTSAAANGASALSGGVPPVHVMGIAITAASAAGEFIQILLR